MDTTKIIEMLIEEDIKKVETEIDKLVVSGKADIITKIFAKLEKELGKLDYDEAFEDENNMEVLSYYLNFYKAITKLILTLGKSLRVDNFIAIEDAYEIEEFAQGYVEDYKMLVEDFFEEDEAEVSEMNELYNGVREVFTDADYDE